MPTDGEIRETLDEVLVPGAMRSLGKLNLIQDIEITDGKLNITLASAAIHTGTQNWLKRRIIEVTRGLDGVEYAEINFTEAAPKDVNQIRNVVAIMSGKGGVGKSLVTSLTALTLVRRGYEVGILDADITGPSIPRMFGLSDRPLGSETGFLPPVSRAGITIMSVNLLLPNEDDAVIWRGPIIGKVITQFWEEVLWGKLDYLLVDLPPGTADAPLTVMQTLPLSGVIIAFTPQDLAAMVVRKAMQMANKMNVPIKGVVENMSYFLLPDSGKRIEIFGSSKSQQMADTAGAPLLGQFPIDPQLAQLCDEGGIERYYSKELEQFAKAFLKTMGESVE
jgi:hydrogenase maturation protease